MTEIIVTTAPDAPFIPAIARIDAVTGFRFNTGYSYFKGSKVEALRAFKAATGNKTAWIDLKTRELKLLEATEINAGNQVLEINHKVKIDRLPAALYFNEGKRAVEIDQVIDGNKLHVKIPPGRKNFNISFGKGTSFNMPDAKITDDFLTARDIEFVKAARELGMHDYCLSYVEAASDFDELLRLDPAARIIAKIESPRGLQFVATGYRDVKAKVRLLAARGDMYVELDRPHDMLHALKVIIDADPRAIGASRLLLSFLEPGSMPSCSDICDIGFLFKLGYKSFLLGDELCADENVLKSAIGVILAIQESYLAGRF
ncbi:MAG: pyruvate kinase [Candidatus Sigynarchaeum springense]